MDGQMDVQMTQKFTDIKILECNLVQLLHCADELIEFQTG